MHVGLIKTNILNKTFRKRYANSQAEKFKMKAAHTEFLGVPTGHGANFERRKR